MPSTLDTSTNSGDGWLEGPNGEMRWGRFGAAGVFIFNPATESVLLQERAIWTAEGGTWGIPGGAVNGDETVLEGALRETFEETGLQAELVTVREEYKVDLGWWSYTTFIATVQDNHELNFDEESASLEWIPFEELENLPLHSAFAAALPELFELAAEYRKA